jgi:DNA repair photolyase
LTKTSVEYATDQITIYPTCPFKCKYCWASTELMRYRTRNPRPIEEAKEYAKAKNAKTIVISFTSDPYPPIEIEEEKTKQVLEILLPTIHEILILTKSDLVQRDFNLLSRYDNVGLGMTVTALSGIPDEPYAPSNEIRIETLRRAHEIGIKTWMSIEPSLPGVTNWIEIINDTYPFVDKYVLGKLNYASKFGYEEIRNGYYKKPLDEAIKLLKDLGKQYHIKSELEKYP